MNKTIHPLVTDDELAKVVDYFLSLSPEDDVRMGTDRKNLPKRDDWIQLLINDAKKDLHNRQFFYIGFFLNGKLIGHSNINKIQFGKEAYFHLHIWFPEYRKQRLGDFYVKEAIKYYFEHFKFKKIICEPNAINPAPQGTLLRCGFSFCRTYRTKPSMLSLEHDVNRYEISLEEYKRLLLQPPI